MSRNAKVRTGEGGMALAAMTVLSLLSIVLVGTFLTESLRRKTDVDLVLARKSAFAAAETGLNRAVADLWSMYRGSAAPLVDLNRLDGKLLADDRYDTGAIRLGPSVCRTRVIEVELGTGHATVLVEAEGTHQSTSQVLRRAVRFEDQISSVFEYAYFVNNYGWLWGSGITVNGDVRSNGNFSLSSARVNGDIFGGLNEELGALGSIAGSSSRWTIPEYRTRAGGRAPPTSPSADPEDTNGNGILDPGEDRNGNGVLDDFDVPLGYGGTSTRFPGQEQIDMPMLSDLSRYRLLASTMAGRITQEEEVLVEEVLGDGEGEGQSLILIGTEEHPIVLDGPVVVENDVLIKGWVTGQGTIYAGRNLHILGDIKYVNPPSWPKPSMDPDGDRERNAAADLLGLAARGSIVIGNYTQASWKTSLNNYQRPPFTQPYRVDATDEQIGYVTDHDADGNPIFHGNYTAFDGGRKNVHLVEEEKTPRGRAIGYKNGYDRGPRRYYEASFPDDVVDDLADSTVRRIDAVLYTNHLLSGRVSTCEFNGTIVARDEAILYSGSVTMNFDMRTKRWGSSFIEVGLPRTPTHRTLYWSEGR